MLDIVRILRMLQDLKILYNAVLNNRQTLLSLFQKNMLIDLTSDNEHPVNKMIKLRGKVNSLNDHHHTNGVKKMRKYMQYYM